MLQAGTGNLWFYVELIIAQLIFSYSFPKKKNFLIRYIFSFALMGVMAFFFPLPQTLMGNTFYQLFRFLLILGYTCCVYYFSFDIKSTVVISTCVSGYALQHFSYHVSLMIGYSSIFSDIEFATKYGRSHLIELIFFPIIYLIALLTFGLFIAKKEFYKYYDKRFNILSVIIVIICVGYTRLFRYFPQENPFPTHIYALTTLFLALYIQYILYYLSAVSQEKKAVQLLMEQDRQNYELSKENIELINTKCHDLRHQINTFKGKLPDEEIKSIKDAINIYDSSLKTGNEVLDVLIMNYKLKTLNNNIELTISGDASCLNFLSITDVSSLFGNAIENAIEAVTKVPNPDKKIISINIESKGDMISVSVFNFFEGEISIRDGLPLTSKKDDSLHGFGIKSIKRIVKKHGGDVSIDTQNNIFKLSFYLLNNI